MTIEQIYTIPRIFISTLSSRKKLSDCVRNNFTCASVHEFSFFTRFFKYSITLFTVFTTTKLDHYNFHIVHFHLIQLNNIIILYVVIGTTKSFYRTKYTWNELLLLRMFINIFKHKNYYEFKYFCIIILNYMITFRRKFEITTLWNFIWVETIYKIYFYLCPKYLL